jgi:hypothetical protein
MKRIWLLVAASVIFALCVSPAFGAADTVDVTISVPALSTFDAGGDVTLTATATDLDNTYVFAQDDSTMTLQDNTAAWTLTAQLDTAYTDYSLWVEDSQAAGNATGASFVEIVNTGANALTTLAGYGTTGDHTFNLDWLATGLSWTTTQSDQLKTVTFTHST